MRASTAILAKILLALMSLLYGTCACILLSGVVDGCNFNTCSKVCVNDGIRFNASTGAIQPYSAPYLVPMSNVPGFKSSRCFRNNNQLCWTNVLGQLFFSLWGAFCAISLAALGQPVDVLYQDNALVWDGPYSSSKFPHRR